ncbi:MAG: glycosyltransferase [Nitrospinaceae bacterium]
MILNSLRACVKSVIPLAGLVYILLHFPWRKKPDSDSPRLLWGPVPIINYKYWCQALKEAGYESATLMSEFYASINKREDFDRYYEDLFRPSRNRWILGIQYHFAPYQAFSHAINHFDIFHHPFTGGFLGSTRLWRLEAPLMKLAGCKSVVIAHGGDSYQYSTVIDPSLRHGLLLSYPESAKMEETIEKKVRYWTRSGDVLIVSFMMDGVGRWDCLPFAVFSIDCQAWEGKKYYNGHDGKTGPVTVMHAPNHRGFKGTEFIIQAVDDLKKEGLNVDLLLVEKVPNDRLKAMMEEKVDILADQLIATGYAMYALEGMACGIPVLSNLEHEYYTRLFRRYSYLNECPILSASPETIRDQLRILVTRPALRENLGRAGRRYVEKYHSLETARYMFGSVYDKIWRGKEVDLMNLFHPMGSEYNKKTPPVEHVLVENRLPPEGPPQ